MMNKAGVQSAQAPGTAIPTPEGYVDYLLFPRSHSLPHAFSPPAGNSPSTSPNLVAGQPGHTSLSPTSSQSSGTAPIAVPSGGAHAQDDRLASPFQAQPGVGVGISPAATSDAMEVPAGVHRRRPSER